MGTVGGRARSVQQATDHDRCCSLCRAPPGVPGASPECCQSPRARQPAPAARKLQQRDYKSRAQLGRASDSARGLARGQQQPCGHGNAAQLSRGALTAGRRAEQGSVGFLTQKQGCCRLRPGRGAGFLAGADADAPGPAAGAAIAACATAHTPLGDPCAGAAGGGAATARAAAPRREPAILVLRGASCHGRASAAGGGRGARRATQKTESPQWPESPLERRRAAARRPRRAARRASGPRAAPPGRYFAPTWRPARAARRPAFRIWPESPRQLVA